MTWKVTLADVRLTKEQRTAAMDVLDSGWLSMGPRTASFEASFATDAAVSHAIAVSSATAGLIVALQVLGVGPGDEVVVPSLTFVADANAVRVLGAEPVFADIISVDRPVLDVEDVYRSITDRTKVVLPVHYAGYPADVESLLSLRERGIAILEDASHAVGPVADDGRWLPFQADMAVFSFFANKNLSVGEGGMVTTADEALEATTRLLRSHGMTTGTWDRHRGHASEYDVSMPGWNFRPQEVSCAIGEAGLDVLAEHNARRRRVLAAYRERFAGTRISMVFESAEPTTAHLAAALLPSGRRDAVRTALAEAGIQSSFHYPPIHRFSAYWRADGRALPVTDDAAARLITLPLHPWLDEADIDNVVEVVVGAV